MSGLHTLAVRPSSLEAAAGLLPLPPPQRASLPSQVAEVDRRAPQRLRRILVATDGTAASQGALAVAGLLARRDGAAVDVISALPRWGAPPPAHEFLDVTGELLASRLARVIPQSETAFGGGRTRWTVSIVDSSSIPASIAEAAEAEGYDLIVTGVRRGWVDRLFRRPTALAVAHRAPVPVLAVPQSVTTLPKRAVVGIDGSEAALAASYMAARLLDAPATVHLTHVVTAETPRYTGLAPLFERHVQELDGSELLKVERRVLRGDKPAERLLAHAGREKADLIALGSHEPTSFRGRLLGGVSQRILRAADGCVLLAGRAAVASRTAREAREPQEGVDEAR